MASEIYVRTEGPQSLSLQLLFGHLKEIRQIIITTSDNQSDPQIPSGNTLSHLKLITDILFNEGHSPEAEALASVSSLSVLGTDFGGLGYRPDSELGSKQDAEVLFLVSAWLESLNSADRSRSPLKPLISRPPGRRGMTLGEKILAAHDIDQKGSLTPGDVVRVSVDWVMASELSWNGMEQAYDSLGKPGIFRNDRFWLAGDHVVDPRINHVPKVRALLDSSERAKRNFRMTEYQGNNYTIMHTEFFRERAEPGMLVIGSDSHTCSAGSMGALAIGLGVADVTMPLITGETWFRVPESVNIRLINAPGPAIGGKDTILYIMKELKRNTVASDRIVEFTGPGLAHLSCDARFAIANMTTEFGGITGIFVPDETTNAFVQRRKSPRYKKSGQYYRPDDDAVYVETHVIDLAQVESFVARYPSPDDVVPVSELSGTSLDGCFIGACTTAEEDLIIGALVLESGLKDGLVPRARGIRKVVPGSLPILHKLKTLGLADIYEDAGFEIGIPGCSYCVGMGADKAGVGEVWISSQNRNFENRMGKGSIGHLGSAATVAASSFNMKITDPKPFLDKIDHARLREILNGTSPCSPKQTVQYVEPRSTNSNKRLLPSQLAIEVDKLSNSEKKENLSANMSSPVADIIEGKVQRLGDFIDTDALAPAEALTTCKTEEEFGRHCLEHTHPDFRARAQAGLNIVVAGKAFGVGSSRENAVSALKGTGIRCVIAKSFAFIYGRNQPNLGLLGITITDEAFYRAAVDETEIKIDLERQKVTVRGCDTEWVFILSPMERKLIETGGMTGAFQRFGKKLFEIMCAPAPAGKMTDTGDGMLSNGGCGSNKELQW